MRHSPILFLTALFAFTVLLSTAHAEKKPLTPSKEWSGSVADESLGEGTPDFIASAEDLAGLWKKWGIADELPTVDFSKELVVLTTTRGSRLRLIATLDDATGNLEVGGLATRDLRPGFRYVIATVSRDGVKTVNGKELPKSE